VQHAIRMSIFTHVLVLNFTVAQIVKHVNLIFYSCFLILYKRYFKLLKIRRPIHAWVHHVWMEVFVRRMSIHMCANVPKVIPAWVVKYVCISLQMFLLFWNNYILNTKKILHRIRVWATRAWMVALARRTLLHILVCVSIIIQGPIARHVKSLIFYEIFKKKTYLIFNFLKDNPPNPCLSNPCLNGGECQSYINSYTCSCKAYYSGANCQTCIWNWKPWKLSSL